FHGETAADECGRKSDGGESGKAPQRGTGEETTERRALGARCELGESARPVDVAPDGEHRGVGRRLYRSRRQNDSAAQGGGEIGSAARAKYDGGGCDRSVESASGKARLPRNRWEYDRGPQT